MSEAERWNWSTNSVRIIVRFPKPCSIALLAHLWREWTEREYAPSEPLQHGNLLGNVKTIIGGPEAGGESNCLRKAYTRSAKGPHDQHEMNCTFRPSKVTRRKTFSITFIDGKALRVQHLHDEANVMTTQMANHMVYHLLIDNESLIDVLYASVYNPIWFKREILKPVLMPLMR